MFSRKEDLAGTRNLPKTRTNMFTITKFHGNRIAETGAKSKTEAQKMAVVADFSLNALTKELEIRKKRMNIEEDNSYESEIFLS